MGKAEADETCVQSVNPVRDSVLKTKQFQDKCRSIDKGANLNRFFDKDMPPNPSQPSPRAPAFKNELLQVLKKVDPDIFSSSRVESALTYKFGINEKSPDFLEEYNLDDLQVIVEDLALATNLDCQLEKLKDYGMVTAENAVNTWCTANQKKSRTKTEEWLLKCQRADVVVDENIPALKSFAGVHSFSKILTPQNVKPSLLERLNSEKITFQRIQTEIGLVMLADFFDQNNLTTDSERKNSAQDVAEKIIQAQTKFRREQHHALAQAMVRYKDDFQNNQKIWNQATLQSLLAAEKILSEVTDGRWNSRAQLSKNLK
jgi:hypothetical protein